MYLYQALGLVNNQDGEYNRDVAITHDHEPILEKGECTQREVLSQVSQPESWPVAGLCFE